MGAGGVPTAAAGVGMAGVVSVGAGVDAAAAAGGCGADEGAGAGVSPGVAVVLEPAPSGCPQLPQKTASVSFLEPQFGQFIGRRRRAWRSHPRRSGDVQIRA